MGRVFAGYKRMTNLPRYFSSEDLKNVLRYDAESGVFTWIANRGRRIKSGQIAGCYNANDGRHTTTVYGHCHTTARLVWLYVTGVWPDRFVDHINGDRSDNRFCNLRQANNSENMQNQYRPASKRSKSGFLGVCPAPNSKGRWRATIYLNKNQIHLGCFPTKESAYQAYVEAKRVLHPFGNL